ncbi:MAG: RNA polymerase sigma factor [Acidimicrobiales bacterium]
MPRTDHAPDVVACRQAKQPEAGVSEQSQIAAIVDASLVASVAQGHGCALAALYARHGAAVYGVATGLCGPEHATEIAAELFVSLWKTPKAFDSERGSVRSHLISQAHRLAVDAFRASTNRRASWDTANGGESSQERADILVERARGEVRDALRALPPASRHAVVLTYFGGYTLRQVAEQLGQSERTTRNLVRTGLDQLRAGLSSA